ncbi:helix-turn-helix domain-containing protein [uncultured Marinococcus sp.]|uniref:helix-turn-helix domain-containing protein n=1 Tax=uncultured Marinococcus sp. TaxID=487012 RepID=UPI002629E14F|nr:helix-turn-helix domain-containing protein [uncultured Marinococcus sp.]
MEILTLGTKLKDLRQYYEVSQSELAKSICSQKAISKIERNEMQPTAEILNLIAIKLGVKISYFFDDHEAPRFNYIRDTKDKIDKLIRDYDFIEAMNIIREELKNPLFRKPVHKKFLLWKRAILHFKLTNEKEEALELLQLARDLKTETLSITEEDIGIIINFGTIFMDTKEFSKAVKYFDEARTLYKKLPIDQWGPMQTKIYFNTCVVYANSNKFKEGLKVVDEGIKNVYEQESLYLLGELYYQKGICLYYLGNIKEALRCMEKSLFYLEEKGQTIFYDFILQNYLRFQRAALAQRPYFQPGSIDPTTATV